MSGLAASHWALPTLDEFLTTHVQRLDASSLSPEDSCCHICQEDFPTSTPITPGFITTTLSLFDERPHPQLKDNGVDEPLLLPCGHIYGSACLQAWFATSGATSCPMCARSLFVSPSTNKSGEFDQGARYHGIRAIPLRELLTRPWNDEQILTLNDDVTELVGRLPRVMWKIAVRLLGQRQDYAGPRGVFDMYDDDATNLFTFYDRHVYLFDDDEENGVAKQRFGKFLLGEEIGAQYARVCIALRRLAGKSMSAQCLYEELVGGDEEVGRVVKLAVRAVIDLQQRISAFVAGCEEETGDY